LPKPMTVDPVFRPMRLGRYLDRSGYAHYRRWRIHGERGLACHKAALWVAEEALTIEYEEKPLAQHLVAFAPRRKEVRKISLLQLFATRYQSPQSWLWHLGTRDIPDSGVASCSLAAYCLVQLLPSQVQVSPRYDDVPRSPPNRTVCPWPASYAIATSERFDGLLAGCWGVQLLPSQVQVSFSSPPWAESPPKSTIW